MRKKLKRVIFTLSCVIFAFVAYITYSVIDNYLDRNLLEESSLRLVIYKDDGTNFGSAIIFDKDDTYYYALTNDHVLADFLTVTVIDYENNRSVATVVDSNPDYDLAVIKFKSDIKLKMIDFADEFSVYDEVTAVGYPSSVYDETNGSITAYETINYDITFAVIVHSADISKGSSGGALLNQDHELVGINFAGYFDEQILTEGYAIPINQIEIYLEGVNFG